VKRNLSVVALLLSLVVSSFAPVALAQEGQRERPGSSAATATAPARAPQAVQWVHRQLQNGLEVVVLEDHSVPLVTVEMAVKNGSFTEPPELNGLSHLFEHMFF
jgi:zinc protease